MYMIKETQKKGKRALFVVDRRTLVEQTSERFFNAGIQHGVAMGQSSFGYQEKIQVGTIQTLMKRGFLVAGFALGDGLYAAPEIDIIFVDECHEVHAAFMDKIVEQDIRCIGLSATPLNPKQAKYYQGIVNTVTTNDLLNSINPKTGKTYLAPFEVVASKHALNVDGFRLNRQGEWVEEDISEGIIVNVGNYVDEWIYTSEKFFGGPVKTITFCARVADADKLAQEYQERGYDFRTVHYRNTEDENKEAIKNFKAGAHIGLITCIALTKGFDVPDVRILQDCYAHRKALIMILQKYGRLIRAAPGKDKGVLLDHTGNFLGFEPQILHFYSVGVPELPKGKVKQQVRLSSEETEDRRCTECGYVLPPRSQMCPSCGAARRRPPSTTINVDGDFEHVTTIDGRGGFKGNWWAEVCKWACQRHPTKYYRARALAENRWKDLMRGQHPPSGFAVYTGEPEPVVAKHCDESLKRWAISQGIARRKKNRL